MALQKPRMESSLRTEEPETKLNLKCWKNSPPNGRKKARRISKSSFRNLALTSNQKQIENCYNGSNEGPHIHLQRWYPSRFGRAHGPRGRNGCRANHWLYTDHKFARAYRGVGGDHLRQPLEVTGTGQLVVELVVSVEGIGGVLFQC